MLNWFVDGWFNLSLLMHRIHEKRVLNLRYGFMETCLILDSSEFVSFCHLSSYLAFMLMVSFAFNKENKKMRIVCFQQREQENGDSFLL